MILKPGRFLAAACAAALAQFVHAADSPADYLDPKVLTGTIYADADLKEKLFNFRREATNSDSAINVLRDFNLPTGALAARERVVYQEGRLKSFQLEELQTGAKGSAVVQTGGGDSKIVFNYSEGEVHKAATEKFSDEILVSDMVGPFIAQHWDALMKGGVVKCRLVSISRVETVGFKFFKTSDTTWRGRPAVLITLQPSSIIIAHLVAPLHFFIEKDGQHRVFEYTGRTTPSIQKKGKWEDLDAVTVFDWK